MCGGVVEGSAAVPKKEVSTVKTHVGTGVYWYNE